VRNPNTHTAVYILGQDCVPIDAHAVILLLGGIAGYKRLRFKLCMELRNRDPRLAEGPDDYSPVLHAQTKKGKRKRQRIIGPALLSRERSRQFQFDLDLRKEAELVAINNRATNKKLTPQAQDVLAQRAKDEAAALQRATDNARRRGDKVRARRDDARFVPQQRYTPKK